MEVLTAQQSPGPDSGRNTGSRPGADSDSEIRPAVAEAVSTAVSALVTAAVTQAFREEWGRVVATLIRVTGDWDLADECAQEAFAVALTQWQSDGIPRRPGAWLTTVAHRSRSSQVIDRYSNRPGPPLLCPAKPVPGVAWLSAEARKREITDWD